MGPISAASLLFVAVSALAEPPALRLTTEHSPPDIMLEDGEIIGISTDKVRDMMARAGVRYDITMLPWKRAYTMAQNQPDTCVYSTTRTPEREALFKWAGPTRELEWVMYGRADRNFKLGSLDDARGLRIGVYNGDVRADYLTARGFNVAPVQNDISNPTKLMANRIDLWATSESNAESAIAANGWAGKIVQVLRFNRVKLYLACNLAVPDETIRLLNEAMERMIKDGSAARIDRKYDNWTERKASAR